MRLHLIGIFNTIHSPEFSQCAFTGKCLRFAKMMQPFDYEIIEYSNEGSESLAAEKVTILPTDQFRELRADYNREFPRDLANMGSKIYRAFNEKLIEEITKRAQPGELILHPLGHAHSQLGGLLEKCYHIEPGVGYDSVFFEYKVFESYAWWHFHQGKANRSGSNFEWVIPNYYDLTEWEAKYEPGSYVLYFGRICPEKGMNVIQEIAKHTNRDIIICGGGDPTPWLSPDIPNLIYKKPVNGHARSELLQNAYCMLMPTIYPEPFGGAGVEGMLCGTPLVASDYGAFSETVTHGVTGFRCKILGDWLYAIEQAGKLDRRKVAETARNKYNLEQCGKMYDRVFRQIDTLKEKGWFTTEPFMAVPSWEPAYQPSP